MRFEEIIALEEQITELRKELAQELERKNLALNLISKLMGENAELKRVQETRKNITKE